MQGDFTRSTFDQKKRYTSVRMQQGRVQLDADWNEQADILLRGDRAVATDVIGRCGVPEGNAGFKVTPAGAAFAITPGHLYVDGILCENDPAPNGPNLDLLAQPDFPGFKAMIDKGEGIFLIYADVWERHINALDDLNIREVALGGPDTATRTRLIWQVKARQLPFNGDLDALKALIQQRDDIIAKLQTSDGCADREMLRAALDTVIDEIAALAGSCGDNAADWDEVTAKPTGRMKAYSAPAGVADKPCIVPPGGGYRRLENQLYRVEIHRGTDAGSPTFKWSRENASVVFPVGNVAGNIITVARLGRDRVLDVQNDDWVEILDDDDVLLGRAGELYKVLGVNHATLEVKLDLANGPGPTVDLAKNPRLRRWDQRKGATAQGVALQTNKELELEDGVKIFFEPGGTFRSGDYWMIPARAALADTKGDVIWPREAGVPAYRLPAGIGHHYCKLARVVVRKGGPNAVIEDCRDLFSPLTDQTSFHYVGGDGQEAMPGEALPQPLQVGVVSDKWPVRGVKVRFELLDGGGILDAVNGKGDKDACSLVVETNAEGIAACRWTPDPNQQKPSQRVRASIVGADGRYLPVYFTANLSLASKVAYTPGDCARLAGVTTVQEALDKLCKSQGGICTLVVTPGRGWEDVFDMIPKGADAQICFPVGVYEQTRPVLVKGAGRLSLKGAGWGTRIVPAADVTPTAEFSLAFAGCESVSISDMYIESNPLPYVSNDDDVKWLGKHLRGVLTFAGCGDVDVDRVMVKAGPALERCMSCLTVVPASTKRHQPDKKRRGDDVSGHRQYPHETISMKTGFSVESVRIRHSDFVAGFQQVGILLVDVNRAQVEDNIVRVGDRPIFMTLADDRYRARFTNMITNLVRRPGANTRNAARPGANERTLKLGEGDAVGVKRLGDIQFGGTLGTKIFGALPGDLKGTRDRKRAIARLVDKLLTDKAQREEMAPELEPIIRIIDEGEPFAHQGIVVAGKRAREVRLLNNSITGFIQGIHAGFSYRQSEYRRYTAGTLLISGNRIETILPLEYERERNGIFVGNCDSLIVENNYVSMDKPRVNSLRRQITGIRIHGILGDMMIGARNHVTGYFGGIVVHPIFDPSDDGRPLNAQWLLRDNLLAFGIFGINAHPRVRLENNVFAP